MAVEIITNNIVASRYANALYSLAIEGKNIDEIWQGLCTVKAVIDESPKAKAIVENSNTPILAQENLLQVILKNTKFDQTLENFLKLLVQNNRFSILPFVIRAFEKILRKENNELEVRVVSTSSLSDTQIKEISALLEKTYSKKILCENKVDENIIGGLIVKVGSKMIDCSLSSKLKSLRQEGKKALRTLTN